MSIRSAPWPQRFYAASEFFMTYGRLPSPMSMDSFERTLGSWLDAQVKSPDPGRVARIDQSFTDWRSGGVVGATWMHSASVLQRFVRDKGRFPEVTSQESLERGLALWQLREVQSIALGPHRWNRQWMDALEKSVPGWVRHVARGNPEVAAALAKSFSAQR